MNNIVLLPVVSFAKRSLVVGHQRQFILAAERMMMRGVNVCQIRGNLSGKDSGAAVTTRSSWSRENSQGLRTDFASGV